MLIKFCLLQPLVNFVDMKIEQHISQLLYRYQCVTVPGFGAFLTETQPAQLNETSSSFYPPKTLISFNGYLRHNDGLLANHIARAERTSYDEAVEAIRSEVAIWKQILDINQNFMLKNIGELSLNAENKLVFKPHEQLNYLKDAFGLSSFVSPSIKRESYKEEVVAIEEKAPISITPESRKSRNYLKYTAIIALALTATGTIGFKVFENYQKEQSLVVESAVHKKVQDKIQEATFVIENPIPAVTMTVADQKKPYHVVAGAFRKEKNAERIYEKLSKLGYKARKLEPNQYGLHPVLYGSYSSYREAWRAMNTIKKSHNPDAWLLIKEL